MHIADCTAMIFIWYRLLHSSLTASMNPFTNGKWNEEHFQNEKKKTAVMSHGRWPPATFHDWGLYYVYGRDGIIGFNAQINYLLIWLNK